MHNNDEDFSRKSKAYRKHHMDAIKALYGNTTVKPYTKRKVKRRIDPIGESVIQVKLVTWAKSMGYDLISIPNHGKRSYWTGQKEVAMGLTRGVSDLFLAQPNGEHHGFWIELKSLGKIPTPDQHAWLQKMRTRGYKAEWYNDFDIARDAIIEYLGING